MKVSELVLLFALCITKDRIMQFSSVAQSCPTLCDPMAWSPKASLSFTIFQSLLKLMSIESVMPSNHLVLCHPLLLLPSIFPSIRVFLNESALRIRWPKYRRFSFNISPSNEYSGLISFRMDWLDFLATPSPTPQFKSINSSALIFLYSPTLTFIYDYWNNHSFDYTDLCRQSGFCLIIHYLGLS